MTNQVQLPEDIPPAWANSLMKWALTKPWLQSSIGTTVALLTFTGRRSGRSYTIPVSYHRDHDRVTVITKRIRNWWRNFETPAEVELRLAGKGYHGKAEIETDDSAKLAFMTRYLSERPVDAKAYGLKRDEITEEVVARILPQIVVIGIDVAAIE